MRTFLQLCCLIAILCIKFCENEKNDIILGKALLLAFKQGVFYLSMIKIQKVLSLFVLTIQRLPAQCSIKQDGDKSCLLAISGLSRPVAACRGPYTARRWPRQEKGAETAVMMAVPTF